MEENPNFDVNSVGNGGKNPDFDENSIGNGDENQAGIGSNSITNEEGSISEMGQENEEKKTRIVQTDIGAKNGQNKCPKCGSTSIALSIKKGLLRCNYCRFEFAPEKVEGWVTDIKSLNNEVRGSGTSDIAKGASDVVTFKCSSCGAEVVVDTASSNQARCHWCRSILSVNQQIPNGAVPDMILPFKLSKDEAKKEIEKFVGKRKFFANPTFAKEFTTQNIMGVYFPYMVVDINSHAHLAGQGEKTIRSYGTSDRKYYDAELYDVDREFDLTIEGLTIESNADRLKSGSDKTNNIINTIMPFDVENSVKYDSNYLSGYSSEKRTTNINDLEDMVNKQAKDIARYQANSTIQQYTRGVKWESEELDVKGRQWKTAYLPVWLYSYQQVKGQSKQLHYVAVNARTKETMGSVPIHMPKLLGITAVIEIIIFLTALLWDVSWFFLIIGPIFFAIIYSRYRNAGKRHYHERETKANISNIKKTDEYVETKTKLPNAMMEGANNASVMGGFGMFK